MGFRLAPYVEIGDEGQCKLGHFMVYLTFFNPWDIKDTFPTAFCIYFQYDSFYYALNALLYSEANKDSTQFHVTFKH
jgi:hypothetical protein